jgi:hypothetical protein
MARRVLLAAPILIIGCGGDENLKLVPTAPPTQVTQVVAGGFKSPTDAVASVDGSEFYFAAFDLDTNPAIYQVASKPGSAAEKIASGDPLDLPIGLVLACDGSQLYIADAGTGDGNDGTPDTQAGAILEMAAGGGQLSTLTAAIAHPSGLAMGPKCDTLFVTGRTAEGIPALFSLPIGGGSPTVVWMGAPLVAPTGLHVDDQGVAWVMDHLAVGSSGEGVLFAIPSDGSAPASEVVSNLRMGTPGGVSLTAGGGTAVIPTLDASGKGQLTTVDIGTKEVNQVAAPDMLEPAGLRTAREAGVFAVVDAEGGAIYRAE